MHRCDRITDVAIIGRTVPRRRVLSPVPIQHAGQLAELDAAQAHHARDVLRLTEGAVVELFDAAGTIADATIAICDARSVAVRVDSIHDASTDPSTQLIVASAVPKGDRADWMIEKLTELGVARFIPLATARSVVLPERKNKRDRWHRIATESAKQSRRMGVMQIDELTTLDRAVASVLPSPGTPVEGERHIGVFLSTELDTPSLPSIIHPRCSIVALFIGPEGGWTDAELSMFRERGLTGARLTATILRVETAAVAGAAVALVNFAEPFTAGETSAAPRPT
jgi:16S rRNA (uracil1498-N3)-methyltransferase